MQFLKGISFLLIISFIVSCTTSSQVASNKKIQKRKYRSGLFVQNLKKVQHENKTADKQLTKKDIKKFKTEPLDWNQTEPILLASKLSEYAFIPDTTDTNTKASSKPQTTTKEDTTKINGHDMLLMENGDEIKCKVIEISLKEIKYKKIEFLDGPTYTSSTSEVFMIQFANGTRELVRKDNSALEEKSTFANEQATDEEQRPSFMDEPEPERKLGAVFGVLSLITGILGFFIAGLILGPGAVIFGIAGSKKNRKGRGMAIAGIILGVIDIIGALIVINMYM